MNAVCHKTELVSTLLTEEPNVLLLVTWTKQTKVLPPDDAVKRAVKHIELLFCCLHCAMPTDMLLPRRLWDEPPISGLNKKCVRT